MTDREIVDEYFGSANPNPLELGCLTAGELVAVAAGRLALDHPACEHIALCSPCYRRVRELQMASPDRRSWWRVAAAVACVALGAWAAWYLAGSRPEPARYTWTVDLRPLASRRSDDTGAPPVPTIKRGYAQVEIILPTGSEPGRYEGAIFDGEIRLRHFADAWLKGGRTVLMDRAKYSELQSREYTLGLRLGDENWKTFPIRLD